MKTMLGISAALVVLASALPAVAGGRLALCDRATTPFDTPALAVAVADVVVVVDVLRVGGGAGRYKIVDVLKGAGNGTSPGDTIDVAGALTGAEADQRSVCELPVTEAGHRYVLLLWKPRPGTAAFEFVDNAAATIDATPAALTVTASALAANHPHSAWKSSPEGVDTMLVLDPRIQGVPGDVSLLVLVRNVSKHTYDFHYQDWPPDHQTVCTLEVVAATGAKLAVTDAPIAKAEIAAYFAKFGRTYTVPLAPGATSVVRLARVTTANAGWGYKEELGFRYWPVPTAGRHRITASCVRFVGANALTTAPLSLDLPASK